MTHRELALPVTTTSRQAYQYFLEGQKAWWRYDMRAAVNSFQMAVEADTSFAYAYALLGVSSLIALYGIFLIVACLKYLFMRQINIKY